jgi:hypothetical protein
LLSKIADIENRISDLYRLQGQQPAVVVSENFDINSHVELALRTMQDAIRFKLEKSDWDYYKEEIE